MNWLCPFYRSCPYTRMTDTSRQPVSVATRVESYTRPSISANLRIPVLSSDAYAQAVQYINTQLQNDIMEFARQIEEGSKADAQQAAQEGRPFTPYVISTIYEVTYNRNAIISISIIYYQLIAGRNYYIKTSYNYSLATEKPLSLSDLFLPGVDYRAVINREVREQIQQNPEAYFPGALDNFQGIAADQPFYITNDSLMVYFGFHQIAPTALQIPIIRIPYTELAGAIRPELAA